MAAGGERYKSHRGGHRAGGSAPVHRFAASRRVASAFAATLRASASSLWKIWKFGVLNVFQFPKDGPGLPISASGAGLLGNSGSILGVGAGWRAGRTRGLGVA